MPCLKLSFLLMSARKKYSKFECWSIRKQFLKKLDPFTLHTAREPIWIKVSDLWQIPPQPQSTYQRTRICINWNPPFQTQIYLVKVPLNVNIAKQDLLHKKQFSKILWSEVWNRGFQLMLILVLLCMYFDAKVVFVTNLTLLFRLALAILWLFCDLTRKKKKKKNQDTSLAMVSNGRRNHYSTSFSPHLRTTHYYYQAADVTTKE